MASYLHQLKKQDQSYRCEVFSKNNIEDFNLYLNKIEDSISQDLSDDLKLIKRIISCYTQNNAEKV